MSRYGFSVKHSDGLVMTITDDSTLCKMNGTSHVGQEVTFKNMMNNNNISRATCRTGITVLPGYDWLISLSQSVWFDWARVVMFPLTTGPGGYTRVTARLDATREVLIDYHYTWRENYRIEGSVLARDHIFGKLRSQVISWPVNTRGNNSRYGMQLGGLNKLFVIPEQSQISHLHFKGDVTIYQGWTPSMIDPRLTMNNCICFFYVHDPDLAIGVRVGGDSYSVWGRSGDKYGVSLSSARVKLCIFANLDPRPPERYGVSIRKNGRLLWNSTQDPLIRPAIVDMSHGLHFSEGRFVRTPVSTPFRRPMFAPACIGSGVGNVTHYNGSISGADKFKPTFSTYVSSNGNGLCHAFGGRESDMFGDYAFGIASWNHNEVITSTLPVLVIDGEDFFRF